MAFGSKDFLARNVNTTRTPTPVRCNSKTYRGHYSAYQMPFGAALSHLAILSHKPINSRRRTPVPGKL